MAYALVGTPKDLALLPPRLALGSTMLYHGFGKLKRGAPEQTGQWFESIGVKPGKPLAIATGAAEVFAGLTALLGIATRVGAIAILVTQAVAIAKVHAPKGFDATKGGFEWNLSLIAAALAMLIAGPGRVSAHEALEHRVKRRGLLSGFAPRSASSRSLRAVKLIK